MYDDGIAQLAEDVDVAVVEVGAADPPNLVLLVVLDDNGDARRGLVLRHVDAAARAFCEQMW